ncbi:MAG: 23S rRNA (uracil(1939)-C(5))-methyltransferase RlmD [Xanthomonadales bacterium]|nr:23S rRNA (uracil(1939)-C(5))-methyltransferase RlmD [Xanthomonadales bacterium]
MGRSRKKLSDQPFELDIGELDSKGLGLAVFEEKTLHVFDGLPGEKVIARHLFGRKNRGKAETLEVLNPSADRVEPRCPSFGNCGACSLQHMSMDAQLFRKQDALLNCLRQADVEPEQVYAPLDASHWNYRRKARLSVRDVAAKERVLIGFRERDGRYVADMDECHILYKVIADALPNLARLIETLNCRAGIPQIEVACGDERCALIIRHLEAFSGADVERLRAFARDTGHGIYLQSAGPDSVKLLEPADFQLEYVFEPLDLRFRFEPLDFIQVNGELNLRMVERALELLDPQAEDSILDLFCGLGNFTLPLAQRAGQVTGLEGSAEMVERGRANAAHNGLDNVNFHTADLYQVTDTPPWPSADYNKILLDPPRSGAQELLPWIAASKVNRVLYISCNPETLAKDAGALVKQHGFSLLGAGIMNMFPHTRHSEAIALFERKADGSLP